MKNTVYALAAQRAGRRARDVRPAARAALPRAQRRDCTASASTSPSIPGAGSRSAAASTATRSCAGARRCGRRRRRRRATARRSRPASRDLLILKSSRSAFAGFPRDEYTTLPETRDRLLATSLTATWQYRSPEVDFGPRVAGRPADAARSVRRARQRVGPAHALRDGAGRARHASTTSRPSTW